MPFSNLNYLYEHLPARFRRDDGGLFLKRYLTFFGETLDEWDDTVDAFFEQINPTTASAEFVEWWLWTLFGWAWFPRWFTLADKRQLYGNLARHYARRGTPGGLELWLLDFGIVARVSMRPQFWGDGFWGEEAWLIPQPLSIVIDILGLRDRFTPDKSFYGDGFYGEQYYAPTEQVLTDAEIASLVRFAWPVGNEIFITRS